MENTFFTKSSNMFCVDMESELVKLLNSELTKRNLSNRDAARAMGISHPTLGVILSGEKPSYETCQKISRFLHMPLATVLSLAGLLPKRSEQTEKEEQLLYLFRQLDERQQEIALHYMEFTANQ